MNNVTSVVRLSTKTGPILSFHFDLRDDYFGEQYVAYTGRLAARFRKDTELEDWKAFVAFLEGEGHKVHSTGRGSRSGKTPTNMVHLGPEDDATEVILVTLV